MVTPVSNDKIPSTNEGKTPPSGKRGTESVTNGNGTNTPEPENTAPQSTETVDVGRASQLFNQADASVSDTGVISSPEQAKEVAAEITQKLATDAAEALRAQAGSISGDQAVLLEVAP